MMRLMSISWISRKKRIPWGYSTAYALSAQHRVHHTFAEYLLNKGTLKTKQINQILSMIAPDKKTRWNKDYIEQLYIEYQSRTVDDHVAIEKLRDSISGKTVLCLPLAAVLTVLKLPFEKVRSGLCRISFR